MIPSAAPLRRAVLGAVLSAALLAAGACAPSAPRPEARVFTRELAQGARYAEALRAREHGALKDEEAIAAGYLERLRTGLGSPFRLAEFALRDPRLPARTRGPLAWALLEETRAGQGYRIDPAALARVPVGAGAADARVHLEIIEDAVRGAHDPRGGELAVREAYRLAAGSGAVAPIAPALAASAAALARDRELARRDAEALLAVAGRSRAHPFARLAQWRRDRRFQVEAPPGAPRAPAVEDEAAALVAPLAARIAAAPATPPAEAPERGPALSGAAARRLARLAGGKSVPPFAATWITVQRYDDHLRRSAAGDGRRERAVERFLARARTEESLVAEAALLAGAVPAAREVLALITTEAGVAMRPYAQERVWFPGFPAPSALDLKRTFGLRAVEFDARVPEPWRAYYRHVLGDALADLEGVLPNLDLRGATFRFGPTGREGVALALHDPHRRTITLPPESGAGTIAHEVGHDLDWQVAHTRYGTKAAYGTAHALRTGRGDRFASAARRMPAPPEVPMRGGGAALQRSYAQSPPEVFARRFDGYVATALAARGRSNGYLSSAQDEFLSGYGMALHPGSRGDAVDPLMEMLMVASPVPRAARAEFLSRWGRSRVPSGFEVAHGILGAGPARGIHAAVAPPAGMVEVLAAGEAARAEVAAIAAVRDSALAAWAEARAANPLGATGVRGEAFVRELAGAAAEAKVHAALRARSRALGFESTPGWLHEAWLAPAAPPPFPPAAWAG
jgi:hypothetical protein